MESESLCIRKYVLKFSYSFLYLIEEQCLKVLSSQLILKYSYIKQSFKSGGHHV